MPVPIRYPLHHVTTASPQVAPAPEQARSTRAVKAPATGWHAWLELTKPGIVQLMLVTCVGAMALAARGMPDISTMLLTVVGLALSIGGSSTLNHVLDAPLDRRMARTKVRPVAYGTISARAASVFGVTLFTVGGAILCLGVNNLTAWLGLFGGAFYVAVYTPLKRLTVHNTVIGGVAGAMPPLVGWAAVTGNVDSVLAWTLFAIMFAWQPAHFWPLSLMIRQDYEDAGFKMLPVTHGERATVQATWRWMWLAVATTFIPVITGDVGIAFVVFAVIANALLIRRTYALVVADKARGRRPTEPLVAGPDSSGRLAARGAFLGSLSWLAILFLGFAVDAFVG